MSNAASPPHGPAPVRRSGGASLAWALAAMLAGAGAVLIGAGRSWAVVTASMVLPGYGVGAFGHASVTGESLAPYGALGAAGFALLIAVSFTRGKGRWLVGAALLAVGLITVIEVLRTLPVVGAFALAQAHAGRLSGVTAAGSSLHVSVAPVGGLVVLLGGVLLGIAGVEALRRGHEWAAMGGAFRIAGDDAKAAELNLATEGSEPAWVEP